MFFDSSGRLFFSRQAPGFKLLRQGSSVSISSLTRVACHEACFVVRECPCETWMCHAQCHGNSFRLPLLSHSWPASTRQPSILGGVHSIDEILSSLHPFSCRGSCHTPWMQRTGDLIQLGGRTTALLPLTLRLSTSYAGSRQSNSVSRGMKQGQACYRPLSKFLKSFHPYLFMRHAYVTLYAFSTRSLTNTMKCVLRKLEIYHLTIGIF